MTIQQVILLPLVFTVVFAGLQAALYYHASTVAGAAAQDGARAAAAYTMGSLEAGRDAAESALAQSHGALRDYGVTVSGTADGATVTVTGAALSIVPGITPPVARSATLPWERLT